MTERNKILKKIEESKEVLFSKYPLKSMGIFGSYARNQQTVQSDLDIIVEFSEKIGIRYIDLAEDFEEITGKKVDLVSKNAINKKYLDFLKKDIIYV